MTSSECLKLRVDISSVSVDDIIQIVAKGSEGFAYCTEGTLGENPHMHFYLHNITRKQDWFRSQLRALGLTGNSGYSLKTADTYPIEYLAYMQKEHKVTYFRIPEDIQQQAKDYQEQVKLEMKAKKEARKTVYQQLCELLDTVPVKLESMDNRKQYIEIILDFHIEKNILIRPQQLKVYLETYLAKNSPKFRDALIQDLLYPRH